jgi:hypothetical protein
MDLDYTEGQKLEKQPQDIYWAEILLEVIKLMDKICYKQQLHEIQKPRSETQEIHKLFFLTFSKLHSKVENIQNIKLEL